MAAGPAAVKSCEPILQPVTTLASASSKVSARASESTSSATNNRSRSTVGLRQARPLLLVVLLQALDVLLALEQGLDGAYRGLHSIHREVVRNVLGHRGAADHVGILPRPTVLRRVEDEDDLAALHE